MTRTIPAASNAAVRLFATFARFEFALKEAGFVQADRHGSAMPDWKRFSSLEPTRLVVAKIRNDVLAPELTVRPPKRQVATSFGWEWRDVQATEDAASLVGAIRRVRNNLFHGGKSGPDPRDDLLCRESVACLLALLEVDDGVAAAFEGRY